MKRSYVKSKQLVNVILQHQAKGKTNREIGEMYGLSLKQIENLMYRYRSAKRKAIEHSMPPKRRGRPRKKPITSKRELELEVNRLAMENELLRNFLQSIGRG